QVAGDQVGLAAERIKYTRDRCGVKNVPDYRDHTRRYAGASRKVHSDHPTRGPGRTRENSKPSAGSASEVGDSCAARNQFRACDQFLDLECGARWQSPRARLAIIFVARFVSRHCGLSRPRKSRPLFAPPFPSGIVEGYAFHLEVSNAIRTA